MWSSCSLPPAPETTASHYKLDKIIIQSNQKLAEASGMGLMEQP
jgi:hypothetical protein